MAKYYFGPHKQFRAWVTDMPSGEPLYAVPKQWSVAFELWKENKKEPVKKVAVGQTTAHKVDFYLPF